MKKIFVLPFVFASVSVFASVDQCQSSSEQSAPAASIRRTSRIKHNVPAAPEIGPKLHLTTYIPVRPFAAPSRIKLSAVSRYNCLAPVSMPPGVTRIGYSIPYVGPRPEWGTPTPSYLAVGPMPVYPGSPDDFRPTAYAPPGFVPLVPNDVPEPPTTALMLLGVFLLTRKSPAGLKRIGQSADSSN